MKLFSFASNLPKRISAIVSNPRQVVSSRPSEQNPVSSSTDLGSRFDPHAFNRCHVYATGAKLKVPTRLSDIFNPIYDGAFTDGESIPAPLASGKPQAQQPNSKNPPAARVSASTKPGGIAARVLAAAAKARGETDPPMPGGIAGQIVTAAAKARGETSSASDPALDSRSKRIADQVIQAGKKRRGEID